MGGISTPIIQIGEVISGGTPGSVLFVGAAGDVQQDNANLFWDTAGKILRIGGGPYIHLTSPIAGTPTIATSGSSLLIAPASGILLAGLSAGPGYTLISNDGVTSYIGNGAASSILLQTNMQGGGVGQVIINHTALSNRYVTLTGSNGGNPIIGASAGSLNISSALQLSTLGAFAAGDKYLIVDATGNVHVSALGPAS